MPLSTDHARELTDREVACRPERTIDGVARQCSLSVKIMQTKYENTGKMHFVCRIIAD